MKTRPRVTGRIKRQLLKESNLTIGLIAESEEVPDGFVRMNQLTEEQARNLGYYSDPDLGRFKSSEIGLALLNSHIRMILQSNGHENRKHRTYPPEQIVLKLKP